MLFVQNENDEKYFCEHCDQNPSSNLIEVWGYVSSGKDSPVLSIAQTHDKYVSVRFHLCDDCRKLLFPVK